VFDEGKGVTVRNEFKHYAGGTTAIIQNPLPSAPPIFLRCGKLILTNTPTTRVSRLNNRYTLIAALL
jgi:hypothetical protein